MKKKYFGTDGIRGRVGKHPITPEFMQKLGWAAGTIFKQRNENCKVIIGKDTRLSGYMFESSLEAGLSYAGVNVKLLGPIPTPAIAYLTRTFKADAGIVISASHNHFNDNGIKFFSSEGTKLSDEMELQIEALIDAEMNMVDATKIGKASRINDAAGRYIEFCKSSVPNSFDLEGLKIVLDCANGAAYKVAPSVFTELGAEVITIGTFPDGININKNYGSTSLENLQQKVTLTNSHLGIAFDGDADRMLMVDHTGSIVDGDELMFIIVRDMLERERLTGGVVGTTMTNMGMEIALKNLNIPFVRTNVGDKYIMQELYKRNWQVGGESSGHIVCLQYTTTGDGIISALQVLRALNRRNETLSTAKSGMVKFPQILENIILPAHIDANELLQHTALINQQNLIMSELGDNGRILLRKSGTESLVRIMLEGNDLKLIQKYTTLMVDTVKQIIKEMK